MNETTKQLSNCLNNDTFFASKTYSLNNLAYCQILNDEKYHRFISD